MKQFLLVVFMCSLSVLVCAQEKLNKRLGYSSLGIGYEYVKYSEKFSFSTTTSADTAVNIDIESDYSGGSMTQRAAGFVAVSESLGFYIITGGTLVSQRHDEFWHADIYDASNGDNLYSDDIQRNASNMARTDLQVLVAKQITRKHAWLIGGRHSSTEFKRFNAVSLDPDTFPGLEAISGDYSERVSAFNFDIGYEYNEFYLDDSLGWNGLFQAVLSVPIYSNIVNTGLSEEGFTDSFGGYAFKITGAYGYQVTPNFLVSASMDAYYQFSSEIIQDVENLDGVTVSASIPENTLYYIQPSINTVWSF